MGQAGLSPCCTGGSEAKLVPETVTARQSLDDSPPTTRVFHPDDLRWKEPTPAITPQSPNPHLSNVHDDGDIRWYTVVLPESSQELGVELVTRMAGDGKTTLVVLDVLRGRIGEWNFESDIITVRPGDAIWEVNGFRGDAPTMMGKLTSSEESLTLLMRRTMQYTVQMEKTAPLGLNITDVSLEIMHIKPGIILRYNDYCEAECMVAIGDRILRYNALTCDSPESVLEQAKVATGPISIVFRRKED